MSGIRKYVTSSLPVLLLAIVSAGCRRAPEEGAADRARGSDVLEAKRSDVLVFPEELHVADARVNDFVARAMSVCGRGDYDSFRLLWSVREEPLPRDEFDEGWQAVQTIRVRGLENVRLAREGTSDPVETDTVYVILAEVHLDPAHRAGRREPQREVVLMLVPELEGWRLAKAPGRMRDWIKEKIQGEAFESADPDAATRPDTTAGGGGVDDADAGGSND